MATLTVGTNKQYSTLAAAVAVARDGDTVAVAAGTYVNDFATVKTKISLVAVGGQVVLLDTKPMVSGAGLLTVQTDATVSGFVFADAASADGTAAGLVDTGGALTLTGDLFVGNQNGLVVNGGSAGTVSIAGSEFARNGNGTAASANIGVGVEKAVTITGSYIHDAFGGTEVKSLAASTTITASRIEDNGAQAGAVVVLPNAGVVSITGSTIEKGAGSAAGAVISFGGGTQAAASSLTVSGDTVVSDKPGSTLVANASTVTASVTSDQTSGFTTAQIATGAAVVSGDTVSTVRAAVSTAALVVPAAVLPVEYGRAGAVVADGTVLTVGKGGTYATLAAALAVAHDGDTINVAAGSYSISGLTVSHKVTIEGVGGIASFVESGAPVGGAAFVTTTDVTFANVEISGAATPGGVAAAIHDQAGNLTVVNSYLHDNQAGIVADAGAGSVGVYDSEIARNGTADGRGANVDVAEVSTLTLRNDWVHDAVAGPEVRSRADNTVLAGDRISQATGNGAADVELPNGGQVSITGSVLEKGANSQTAPLVHVGGGSVYSGSAVTVAGDTLISDRTAAATKFIVAEAGSGSVAASNDTYVGGIAGSVQATNATNTGAVVGTGLAVSTTAPWGAAGAPAAGALTSVVAPVATAANGVLILSMSEAAYQGDAKFNILVDGVQVGGTQVAVASHAGHMTQTFTIAGNFAAGPHAVAVQYVNSLSGPGGARDLFVDGATYNGVAIAGAATELTADGSATMVTGAITRATAITVNLSEDAWKGDAQAFISIDGKVQGGLDVVTASHAAGATEAMSFLLNLAPGAHTASVAFLNPAGSAVGSTRNLYVDSINVGGTVYGGSAGALTTSGGTFAFTVAPPAAANTSLFLTSGLAQAVSVVPASGL